VTGVYLSEASPPRFLSWGGRDILKVLVRYRVQNMVSNREKVRGATVHKAGSKVPT
jgi:hypothetical protein